MELFGVRLVGITAATAHKLVLTLGFAAVVLTLRVVLARLADLVRGGGARDRIAFWIRQGLSAATAVILVLLVLSIWFDDPARLASGLGFFSAGLAFALQKVVTALAGYVVILRGKTFTVGDRIQMGGVRGDVISLGFIQTRIMEMGQPPPVSSAEPPMWVMGRQFTGRIVTVTNDKVFDTPVYNYTRDFPFIWDEIHVPIKYSADRVLAEKLLLESAERNTGEYREMSAPMRRRLEERYFLSLDELEPRV